MRICIDVLIIGIYLSHSGINLTNSSFVAAADINENIDHALICHTDNSYCCGSGTDLESKAHWKIDQDRISDGSVIGCTTDCYFRSRGDGEVRLNRRGNPTERGCFHCEIPNDDNVTVNFYIAIRKCVWTIGYHAALLHGVYIRIIHPVDTTMVNIVPSGLQPSARLVGETGFTMECMVTLPCDTEPEAQPTFDWSFPHGNNLLTPSLRRSGNNYISTVRFPPLNQSDAGTYTCRLGGNPRLAASYVINGDYSNQAALIIVSLLLLYPHSNFYPDNRKWSWWIWSYSNCRTELHFDL